MFQYGFQQFIVINVKLNLNQDKYHGHEKADVNLPFCIHVDG